MAELIYSTDFEDVTKINPHILDMLISNWFEFGIEGGANMWVEGVDRVGGPTPRSGSRSIGMDITNISLSSRNEFNLMNIRSLAGDNIRVTTHLYLPSNWGLHAPGIDWNWFEIVTILGQMDAPWLPYVVIHIEEQGVGGGSGIFNVNVKMRDINGNLVTLGGINNFPLPRGQWFPIKYDLHRRDLDSTLKVWFNNQLICEASGLALPLITEDYKITVGKIYYEPSDVTPHYLWVDDLEIWNIDTEPTEPTPDLNILIPVGAAVIGGLALIGLASKKR